MPIGEESCQRRGLGEKSIGGHWQDWCERKIDRMQNDIDKKSTGPECRSSTSLL